jgi:hypothetical protein
MEHDVRITGVLRRAYEASGWTPVEDHTPLDELLEAEAECEFSAEEPDGEWSWPSSGQPDLQLQALKHEEAAAVAAWARAQLVRWLAGGGVHPFRVVQRFYALCFARYGDVIGPLNGTHLAEILGQGRAAFSATMRELFGKPVEAKLGQSLKVAGQKSAAAKDKYAANAAKHCPRQRLNASDLDDEEEEILTRETEEEALKRLADARAKHEQRELERDAAAHEAMTRDPYRVYDESNQLSSADITRCDPAKTKQPRAKARTTSHEKRN